MASAGYNADTGLQCLRASNGDVELHGHADPRHTLGISTPSARPADIGQDTVTGAAFTAVVFFGHGRQLATMQTPGYSA